MVASGLPLKPFPKAGIYVHIPFCRKACHYCNFHFSTSLRKKEAIVSAINHELSLRKHELVGLPIDTLYIGGGTPSLLTAAEINTIFATIQANYTLAHTGEYTLEANPDDINPTWVNELKATPVNRISLGIQSFNDAHLQAMNRTHNAVEALQAIDILQNAGYTNLSIDLIYGIPGMADSEWLAHLQKVPEYGITHFSAYSLTVEENTALHRQIAKKQAPNVLPEDAARHLEMLIAFAAGNGYEHYEVSNLALPGSYARHNTGYWQGMHYLGIGPAAHSYNGATRRANVANNALYLAGIAEWHSTVGVNGIRPLENTPWYTTEHLTPTQKANEHILTTLRTQWGLHLTGVQQHTTPRQWSTFTAILHQNIAQNNLMLKDNRAYLTHKGIFFADSIAADLFIDNEM